MKIIKKLIVFMMVMCMMVLSVACSNSNEKTSNNTPEVEKEKPTDESANNNNEKEKVTDIVYFTSTAKYKDSYDVIARKIEENLNVKIDIQVVPDEQYVTLLKTKLSTNEVPDIFDYNTPNGYSELNVVENCAELSDEPWVSRLVNKDMVTRDGKIYSMPRESSSFYPAMYYNKKVFKDLGLKEPTTYDEFLNVLETIKEAGIIPIHMSNKETWTTQIFMTSAFPAILGKDKAEEVFEKIRNNELKHKDVPEFVKVLEMYKELYDKGYVNKDHLSATYDVSQKAVGTGEAAMMMNGEWVVSSILSLTPDAEIGAFAVPLESGCIGSGAFVQGMFIPKESKNVEMAKKVIDLWSQPEYLNIFFEENPSSPAFTDVDPGDVPECVNKIVTDYVTTGKTVVEYNSMFDKPSPIRGDTLWNYYVELTMGDKTPLEVLEAWDKDVEDFMTSKEFWK